MMNKIGMLILTMFGIGYATFELGKFKIHAQGTVASFATCLFYFMLFYYFHNVVKIEILVLIFIIILVYSITLIDKLSKNFEDKDPKEIVIDEFIGQSIPLLALWEYARSNNEEYLPFFLVFIFFRIFDITKPFPINIIDKQMKNGLGVVLDDIVAGIYSTLLIYFLILFFNI